MAEVAGLVKRKPAAVVSGIHHSSLERDRAASRHGNPSHSTQLYTSPVWQEPLHHWGEQPSPEAFSGCVLCPEAVGGCVTYLLYELLDHSQVVLYRCHVQWSLSFPVLTIHLIAKKKIFLTYHKN